MVRVLFGGPLVEVKARLGGFVRRRHCRRRGWLRFGSISSSVTRWKDVYVRALRLEANWARGRYVVEPILRGHKKRIGCIDCDGMDRPFEDLIVYFFFLGRILVSGSADNTARIWDLEGHKCIRVLDSHSDEVTCIALRVIVEQMRIFII